MTYLVIDQFCIKIAGKVNKEFATEVGAEQVVLEIVGDAWIDGQIVKFNDRLDWIDGVAEVNNDLIELMRWLELLIGLIYIG